MSVYSLLYISWQYLKGHLLKVAESLQLLNILWLFKLWFGHEEKGQSYWFFLIKSLGHKNFQKQRKTK